MRGKLKNPQFQPHIFFSSRLKENVPLTVQKKRRPGEPQGDGSPYPGPPAERSSDRCLSFCTEQQKKHPSGCFSILISRLVRWADPSSPGFPHPGQRPPAKRGRGRRGLFPTAGSPYCRHRGTDLFPVPGRWGLLRGGCGSCPPA